MIKKSLISVIIATTLIGCGGDDSAELDGNTRGSIAITGSDFFAGASLSALATDADGIQAETITYVWSTGTTGTSYTITEADEGTVISVSARYTDDAGFTEGVGASTPVINPTLDVNANIITHLFSYSKNGVTESTPIYGAIVTASKSKYSKNVLA